MYAAVAFKILLFVMSRANLFSSEQSKFYSVLSIGYTVK